MVENGRAEARKLSFSLDEVIRFTAVVLTIAGAFWMATSGLRSDVRDILTQMNADAEKQEVQQRLEDERLGTMRETVNDQKRRLELLQYEVQGLKEVILKLQAEQRR